MGSRPPVGEATGSALSFVAVGGWSLAAGQMLAGLSLAALLAGADATLPSGLQAALQSVADNKSAKYNCSFSIAFLSKDDAVAVAGSPDHQAKTSDLYAFGSGTKPLTGSSILKLVSEGKFGLDDQVAPLVDPLIKKMAEKDPSLNFTCMADLWGEANVANTTIRKLISMKAGVPDFDTAKGFGNVTTDSLREFLYANPHKAYTPLELMNVSWVRGQWNDPSTHRMLYSSTNFMILGLVLAHAAGVDSWEEFDQGSFLPESLKGHLNFATKGSPHEIGAITGYDRTTYNMPVGVTNNKDVSGVDGVFAGWTASDVVASAPHMAEMVWAVYGPEPSIAPEEYAQLMHNNGSDPHAGYGVATFNLNSRTGQPSTSKYGIAYGHLGATYGYQSIVAMLPGFNWSIVVASNLETQTQAQPADAFCFAYGAAAGLYAGRDLNCAFKDGGYFGGHCECDSIDEVVLV